MFRYLRVGNALPAALMPMSVIIEGLSVTSAKPSALNSSLVHLPTNIYTTLQSHNITTIQQHGMFSGNSDILNGSKIWLLGEESD